MNMMTMEHCHLHYLACNNCTFVIWGFHKTRVVMTINYVNFNELLCADLDFAITFCCKQQYIYYSEKFIPWDARISQRSSFLDQMQNTSYQQDFKRYFEKKSKSLNLFVFVIFISLPAEHSTLQTSLRARHARRVSHTKEIDGQRENHFSRTP